MLESPGHGSTTHVDLTPHGSLREPVRRQPSPPHQPSPSGQPSPPDLPSDLRLVHRAVAPRDRPRPLPRLLRHKAAPYLLLGDVAAVLLVATTHPRQLLALPVLVVSFLLSGLYRSRLTLSLLDDLPYLLLGVLAGVVTQVGIAGLSSGPLPVGPELRAAALLLGAVLLVRGTCYLAVRRARTRGRVRHTALMLGAGTVGIRLAQTLQEHGEYGLDPVGFLDGRPRVVVGTELPAPLLGGCAQLAQVIQACSVRVVIVAFGSTREEELVDILRTCDRLDCEIFFVPRLFEISCTTRDMDQAWGIPLVRVRRAPFRRASWRLKRVVDVVLAGLALLLLSMVMLVCALVVRYDGTRGGVFFRQRRVGLDGREFVLLKFRTLAPVPDEEAATRWSVCDDERLGRVGRFLRRTSLDELPQLWNVLTGAMSLVGPRPERPHFVEEFGDRVPRYRSRHRVPAGLTGWAQVHGLRGDTSIEHRASFDNYYIENWSLWGDVKIMVRTLDQVLRCRGG